MIDNEDLSLRNVVTMQSLHLSNLSPHHDDMVTKMDSDGDLVLVMKFQDFRVSIVIVFLCSHFFLFVLKEQLKTSNMRLGHILDVPLKTFSRYRRLKETLAKSVANRNQTTTCGLMIQERQSHSFPPLPDKIELQEKHECLRKQVGSHRGFYIIDDKLAGTFLSVYFFSSSIFNI